MSETQEKTVKLLDSKLDAAVIKTVTTCAIVMIVAVLIHDGDHIRQALNWGYSIPLAASGIINPSIAAAAMALSSNGVLLNALRLKKYEPRNI